MEHLAAQTGGRAFYNTNDLAAARWRRAWRRGGHSYRLDYSPENRRWDGRVPAAWRSPCAAGAATTWPIRQGYFRDAGGGVPGLRRDCSAAVQGATGSAPDAAAAVLLSGERARGGQAAGEVAVELQRSTRRQRHLCDRGDGLRHAKLLVLFVAEPAASGVAPLEKQAVLNVGLEPADYQAALASGIPVRQTIDGVLPGSLLRLGVRDLETGQIGTLRLQ